MPQIGIPWITLQQPFFLRFICWSGPYSSVSFAEAVLIPRTRRMSVPYSSVSFFIPQFHSGPCSSISLGRYYSVSFAEAALIPPFHSGPLIPPFHSGPYSSISFAEAVLNPPFRWAYSKTRGSHWLGRSGRSWSARAWTPSWTASLWDRRCPRRRRPCLDAFWRAAPATQEGKNVFIFKPLNPRIKISRYRNFSYDNLNILQNKLLFLNLYCKISYYF